MKNIITIIVAIFAMAFAATSCSNRNINEAEEEFGFVDLHDPVEWDSSLYVPHPKDDELVDINFKWSTGVGFPDILAITPGVYVFTYTEVYASGIVSSITQTFSTTERDVIIDPVIKVYYFWLSGDAKPIIDVEKPKFDSKIINVYASEAGIAEHEFRLRKLGLIGSRHLRNFQNESRKGFIFCKIIIGKNKKKSYKIIEFFTISHFFMSLANKYRPTTFDTTVGQEHITDILKSKIKNNQQNNHNYLFFGPRGTGKTSVARILSKAMNCLDLQDGNPCNKCANCIAINEGKTLDYVEIDAASHTGVDNIREEILAKTDYPPTQLKKKIYVIDEVHMLSKGAFNALLKTIEEPKDYMSFILATTEIEKVPETIVSRCQVFNFKKIPADKMVARLQEICKQENLGYEDEALDLIERMAEGCARDAVKYIDQVSVFGDISVKNVTNLLGIVGDNTIKEFLEIIKSGDRANIFTRVDEINSQGIDLAQFAKQVIMYIDHHLMEDVEFFLKISEFFGEILSMIRYYPYPNMVYKIVLNKCVSGDETQVEMKKEKPSKVILNETKGSEESIGSKQDSSSLLKPGTAQAPQNDTVETKKVEQQSEINDELFSKIGDQIDSKTLQHGLKNFVHVKSVTDGRIELIVIDKMAEITLKKEENQKLLEQKILENTGKSYSIDIEYMDKDAYFSQMML